MITTVISFTGKADHNYSLIVEAYDNEGVNPSLNNRTSIMVSQANFNCVMLYVVAITNAADCMIQNNLCIMLESYTAPYWHTITICWIQPTKLLLHNRLIWEVYNFMNSFLNNDCQVKFDDFLNSDITQ